jgi:hypothetical protein
MKIRSIAAYAAPAFTLLTVGTAPAAAGTITVGTFDPSTKLRERMRDRRAVK